MAPGSYRGWLHAAVETRLPEGLGVGITQSRTIRAESMRLFDRTFAITRVLRLLAAVIAFAGVFSALLALEAPGQELPRPPGRAELAGHYFYSIEDLLYEL